MNEQSWINDKCERSAWPSGPWDGEPDKVQWKDDATGLDCLANRNPRNGNWCGYVGVPPGHPLHGKDYDDVNVDVHGGLTFASECEQADEPCRGICHVAAPGEPDKLWWLGFDCAHYMDHSPRDYSEEYMARLGGLRSHDGCYRTLSYVKAECASLAGQVAALATP